MDQNEFVDSIIEECSESESEEVGIPKKKARTSKIQIQNLISFVDRIKSTDDKQTVANKWNEISDELNSIGPQLKTPPEWKKVWLDYRSNRQRSKPSVFDPKIEPTTASETSSSFMKELRENFVLLNDKLDEAISKVDRLSDKVTELLESSHKKE